MDQPTDGASQVTATGVHPPRHGRTCEGLDDYEYHAKMVGANGNHQAPS